MTDTDAFVPDMGDYLTLSPATDDNEYYYMAGLLGLKPVEVHHGQA